MLSRAMCLHEVRGGQCVGRHLTASKSYLRGTGHSVGQFCLQATSRVLQAPTREAWVVRPRVFSVVDLCASDAVVWDLDAQVRSVDLEPEGVVHAAFAAYVVVPFAQFAVHGAAPSLAGAAR
jgi:hypothetical protein